MLTDTDRIRHMQTDMLTDTDIYTVRHPHTDTCSVRHAHTDTCAVRHAHRQTCAQSDMLTLVTDSQTSSQTQCSH